MANEIDDIIAQISKGEEKPEKKQEYKPAKGEEAIFERQPGIVERMGFFGSLLPFSKQLTGKEPWGWNPETFMEGAGWASGGLVPGRGMSKKAMQKGSAPIAQALEDILAQFGEKGGVPATIPKGELPALGGGRFQRMGSDVAEGKTMRVPQRGQISGAIQKQLPQYAGPTAPGGIQLPRISRSLADRAQDIIDDLYGASLRTKGLID
jgi:hypothetical protein